MFKWFRKKEIKFCKDCKWCAFNKCIHKSSEKRIDWVTGKQTFFTCETQREWDCGKRAKYFEPKGGGDAD